MTLTTKKIILFMVTVIAVMLGFGSTKALAAGYQRTTPYEKYLGSSGTRYNYAYLTDREKELYDDIYDAITAFANSEGFKSAAYSRLDDRSTIELHMDFSKWIDDYNAYEEDHAKLLEVFPEYPIDFSNKYSDKCDPNTVYNFNPFETSGIIRYHLTSSFRADNPQFFWLSYVSIFNPGQVPDDISFVYDTKRGTDVIYINVSVNRDYYDPSIRSAAEKEIIRVATEFKRLVDAVPNTSHAEYFKGMYLAQLLSERTTYDYKAQAGYHGYAWDMGGALYYRHAVCRGYALAYQYLANICGLEVMCAENEQHEWNQIKLDGKWYQVDTESMGKLWQCGTDEYCWDIIKNAPFKKIVAWGESWNIYESEYPLYAESPYYQRTQACHYADEDGFAYEIKNFADLLDVITLDDVKHLVDGTIVLKYTGSDVRNDINLPWLDYLKNPDPEDPAYNKFFNHYNLATPVNTDRNSDGTGVGYYLFTIDPDLILYDDPTPVPIDPRDKEDGGDDNTDDGDISPIIWVNGNKNTKSITLKTNISTTSWKDSKDKTKAGKLVWVIMGSKTIPELDASHKLVTKTDCKSTATISAKGVVTAKGPGTVYAYTVDTGSGRFEEFPITVKAAPGKINFVDSQDESAALKKVAVEAGSSGSVNIQPYIKNMEVSKDVTYSGKLSKSADAAMLNIDIEDNRLLNYNGLKANGNKVANVKVEVSCNQNGKKGSLTIMVENPVKGISVAPISEKFTKGVSKSVALTLTCSDSKSDVTTDKLTVYVSAAEPVVSGKKITVTASKELKGTLSKDFKTLTLKAGKDLTENVGVYIAITNGVTKEIKIIKLMEIEP